MADAVRDYLTAIGRVNLLTAEEEITLSRQIQAGLALQGIPDPSPEQRQVIRAGERAKSRMVAANLRLVVSIAKKYQNRGLEMLDLIQEGSLGLARGIEKFDPNKGFKLSTYVYWWIRQAITRAIATQARTIRLPIHVTEKLNAVKKTSRELAGKLGRSPTLTEMAAALEMSPDQLRQLLSVSVSTTSLDARVGANSDTALGDLLESGSPDLYAEAELSEVKDQVYGLLANLPTNQQRVLRLRFGLDTGIESTLSVAGESMGVSRERIRQLQTRAFQTLKRHVHSHTQSAS